MKRPFVKGVEAVLQSLNVKRQQYHGGAYIGNHVHKVLQAQHTHVLTSDAYDSTCTEYSSVNERDRDPPC
ncbi:hypothetical protein EMCRGX_G032158 [Ephydatia muelleri]